MGRPKGSRNVVRAKSDYKPEYAGMLLEFFRHYSEGEEAGVPTLQRFAQSIGTYACAVPPGLYHGRSRRRDRFRTGIHARLRRSLLRLRLPEKDRRGKGGGEVRGIEGKHRACGERMRGLFGTQSILFSSVLDSVGQRQISHPLSKTDKNSMNHAIPSRSALHPSQAPWVRAKPKVPVLALTCVLFFKL